MRRGSTGPARGAALLLIATVALGAASPAAAAPALAAPALAAPALAAPALAAPAYPGADGRCVDQVGVLGAGLCGRVTAVLLRDEARSSDEIAVAVIPTVEEASIETWSTGLFNAWGVGKQDKDNGVLLVVAVDDRRTRLATGRGLAERLSDREAGKIVDTVITPQFAKGAYAAGILAGLDEVRRRLGHPVSGNDELRKFVATAPAFKATIASGTPAAPDQAAGGADESSAAEYLPVEPDAFTGDDVDDLSGFADNSGPPAWLFVPFGAVALVVLIGVLARSASGSSAGPIGGRPRRRSPSDDDSTQRAFWTAGSAGSSSWSSGGSDSSGSWGSSFGGGSSDGSGSSGSW